MRFYETPWGGKAPPPRKALGQFHRDVCVQGVSGDFPPAPTAHNGLSRTLLTFLPSSGL